MALGKEKSVEELISYVNEAVNVHKVWRAESWKDYEFRDGIQWPEGTTELMLTQKNVNPITVNRIFPIVEFIFGWFLINQKDVVAKGRTKKDVELGQVMSEALMFVKDLNKGQQKIANAVLDQIITGYGALKVRINPDPRKEPVGFISTPWSSIWWDPYSDPQFDAESSRYAFTAQWRDLEDFCAAFPDKERDIREQFNSLSSGSLDSFNSVYRDEDFLIEDYKNQLASTGYWVNASRKRIRPVEMWYIVPEKRWFAETRNSDVYELDNYSDEEKLDIVRNSVEVVSATVRKMRVSVFLNDLKMYDTYSPLPFDDYPFVSFVAYKDRFGMPYGVPRQITEPNMELNRRRTMALARLDDRRVFVEKDAVEDVNTAYAESGRRDGLIITKPGKIDRIRIQEMSDLAITQLNFAEQTKKELQETAGTLAESMDVPMQVQSSDALTKKEQMQNVKLAGIMNNTQLGLLDLGIKLSSLIQGTWTKEKVLRVTDRVTGVEAYVAINKPITDELGNIINVRNDITKAKLDIVVSTSTLSDTQRDKNIDLVFSAINKAPQEAIGPLLRLGLELSDIPDKERILKQIMSATGQDIPPEDLGREEREAIEAQNAQAQKERQDFDRGLQVQTITADTALKAANAEKLKAEAMAVIRSAANEEERTKQEGFKIGQEAVIKLNEQRRSKELRTEV